MHRRSFLYGAFVAAAAELAALAEPWPQWRGPRGDGTSAEKAVPLDWSPTKNIAWKTPLPGRGHSSPVAWGNRAFVTTSVEGDILPDAKPPVHKLEGEVFVHPDATAGNRKHRLSVLCVDIGTGKILWDRVAYEGKVYDDRHKAGSYASPTPITDGKALYVWFESQGLYCYDFSGKLVWQSSAGPIATVGMGPGTSPVLYNDLIIVQCDQEEGEPSFLAAFSTKTGKLVWKQKRDDPAGWSTPILVRNGSRTELVCNGWKSIRSYNPDSGELLWQAPGLDGYIVPSPVAGNGMVYCTGGHPNKRVYALRLNPAGGERLAWRYDKGVGYVASPLCYGNCLYFISDGGLLTCLDAASGKLLYEGKRQGKPSRHYSSLVGVANTVWITSEQGDTAIVRAGAEYELIGVNSLGESVYASPAIADGNVLIRTSENLVCINPRS